MAILVFVIHVSDMEQRRKYQRWLSRCYPSNSVEKHIANALGKESSQEQNILLFS